MKKNELKNELIKLEINENLYNLEGSIANGGTILFENYNYWEVINIDDRGEQNVLRFKSEDEACDYIFKIFLKHHEIMMKNLNKMKQTDKNSNSSDIIFL